MLKLRKSLGSWARINTKATEANAKAAKVVFFFLEESILEILRAHFCFKLIFGIPRSVRIHLLKGKHSKLKLYKIKSAKSSKK